MSKRIVLRHTLGRLAGLYQIQGTEDQLAPGIVLPVHMTGVNFGDHVGECHLTRASDGYILYTECEPLPQ